MSQNHSQSGRSDDDRDGCHTILLHYSKSNPNPTSRSTTTTTTANALSTSVTPFLLKHLFGPYIFHLCTYARPYYQ